MTDFSFRRGERLKSRKLINRLFSEGASFGQYPLRLVWTEIDPPQSKFPVQFTVSVPKRKFPKAVHRNRIKRQVKEAYRLHKHELYEKLDADTQWAFMIIYTGKETFTTRELEKAMKKIIRRFLKFSVPKKKPTNPN